MLSISVNYSVDSFQEAMDIIVRWLPFLLPLFIIQLGLIAFAVIDIAKRKKTKNLSPAIWIIITIFLSNLGLGAILYLIFGRAEKVYDENNKDDDI